MEICLVRYLAGRMILRPFAAEKNTADTFQNTLSHLNFMRRVCTFPLNGQFVEQSPRKIHVITDHKIPTTECSELTADAFFKSQKHLSKSYRKKALENHDLIKNVYRDVYQYYDIDPTYPTDSAQYRTPFTHAYFYFIRGAEIYCMKLKEHTAWTPAQLEKLAEIINAKGICDVYESNISAQHIEDMREPQSVVFAGFKRGNAQAGTVIIEKRRVGDISTLLNQCNTDVLAVNPLY